MDESFNLVQMGISAVRAKEAIIGTNRALNQTQAHIENLPDTPMSAEDQQVIDDAYNRIPFWKRRLDDLYSLLYQVEVNKYVDVRDFESFVEDFKTTFAQIDSEMTLLGRVLMRHRY